MRYETAGQRAYELDVSRAPTYHTGEPRKTWEKLGDVERLSWERNPTARQYKAQLAAEYVDLIGYDPFKDDPTITIDSVRETLREYHAAASGE